MKEGSLAAWLRLQRAAGVGVRGALRLLEITGSPEAALDASPGTLERAGLTSTTAALHEARVQDVTADLAWAEQPGHHLLPIGDPRYPSMLRDIHDPPLLLYVLGDCDVLAMPQLAIVGTRHPTPNGRDNAFEFARHLASTGFAITSGLALGVDGAAHEGALAADAATVAVAATGLDRVYPSIHRALARRIADTGALVSESPIGTRINRGSFPRRNRIISGLSLGVLVVEAAQRSGSLVTARLAAEQGREVFAIPGSIHNPMARGCHRLIRDGAKLVETAADILEELGGHAAIRQTAAGLPGDTPQPPEEAHVRLLEAMGYDPVGVDLLVSRSGLTPEAVSSMLLILELQGHVTAVDGGRFLRTPRGDRDSE